MTRKARAMGGAYIMRSKNAGVPLAQQVHQRLRLVQLQAVIRRQRLQVPKQVTGRSEYGEALAATTSHVTGGITCRQSLHVTTTITNSTFLPALLLTNQPSESSPREHSGVLLSRGEVDG